MSEDMRDLPLPEDLERALNLTTSASRKELPGRPKDQISELIAFKDEEVKSFAFHSNTGLGSGIGAIRLGNHKRVNAKLRGFYQDFIFHGDYPEARTDSDSQQTHIEYTPNFGSGLSTTKFREGFMRRMEKNIHNDLKDQEAASLKQREEKKAILRRNRGMQLESMRFANGFNVITGETKTDVIACEKPRGKRRLHGSVSQESVHRGMGLLRESEGRFHMPSNSGDYAEKRMNVLVNDGVYIPRTTRLLGSLLPSYGVEDQFSKSEYQKLPERARIGLVETRKPGDFTPRKQAGNPSGDNEIRAKWTNSIKLG